MKKEEIKGGNKFYLKYSPEVVYEIRESTSERMGTSYYVLIDQKYHAGMAPTADNLVMFFCTISLVGQMHSFQTWIDLNQMVLLTEIEEEARKIIKKVLGKSEN